MATAAAATISANVSPELMRLNAQIKKRRTKVYSVAKQLDTLKGNPDYVYKILRGTRPMPEHFIEHFCGLACIPLKDVLDPEEYHARSLALRDEMYLADMDWMA